jgi:hypothetical protein
MVRKIILVVLLIGLVAAIALAGPEGSVRGGSGDRAPVLAPQDFQLDRLEGKVVLMAFWRGKDCLPCVDYIAWLNRMQAYHGEEGLAVVAVNEDLDSAAATDLANNINPQTQIILDPMEKMGASYQLEGIPSTYLYDRNLNMKYKFVGFAADDADSLEAVIVDLLKQEFKD